MIKSQIMTYRQIHRLDNKHNAYQQSFQIMCEHENFPFKYRAKAFAMDIVCSLLDIKDLLDKIAK